MRIAVVSDVHGNRRAFEAVLADLRQIAPDLVVHGGDLAANGAHPEDIIDQVQELGWSGVCGNTDEMLWNPQTLDAVGETHPKLANILATFREIIPATRERLGEARLSWLAALPASYADGTLTLVHASPGDLWRAPMPDASDVEMQNTYSNIDTGIVVYGHIHRPYARQVGNRTFANTGSVSLSYDGDPRASYLVIEDHSVTIRRVEYNIDSEANELLHSGLPHASWLCRILTSGRYCPPE
jgi:predicted phosphodiesterase